LRQCHSLLADTAAWAKRPQRRICWHSPLGSGAALRLPVQAQGGQAALHRFKGPLDIGLPLGPRQRGVTVL